ncbi:MAG TPA: hypothetical protein VN704_01100 [Verrucomicrobiae bacterium]|nr:hypothetical protein [Verrucomicrobiae bacterium]
MKKKNKRRIKVTVQHCSNREKHSAKKMGYRENQLMAQQIQETVHQV